MAGSFLVPGIPWHCETLTQLKYRHGYRAKAQPSPQISVAKKTIRNAGPGWGAIWNAVDRNTGPGELHGDASTV